MGIGEQHQISSIEEDLLCMGCAYNLRGLRHDCKCPECGVFIELSINDARWHESQKPQPLAESDPRWLESVMDGAGLITVAFFLIVLMFVVPEGSYDWRSPQRSVMLGIACTIWVLSWYGLWKITILQPSAGQSGNSGKLRIAVVVGATIYAALPFIPGPLDIPDVITIPIAAAIMFGIPVLSACYYLYVAAIARRVHPWFGPLAVILGVVSGVCAFVALAPELDGPKNSLSQLRSTPTVALGSPALAENAIRMLWNDWDYMSGFWRAADSIASFYVLIASMLHLTLFLASRRLLRSIKATMGDESRNEKNSTSLQT